MMYAYKDTLRPSVSECFCQRHWITSKYSSNLIHVEEDTHHDFLFKKLVLQLKSRKRLGGNIFMAMSSGPHLTSTSLRPALARELRS